MIVALPASREVLRMHLLGSSLTRRLNPSWREDLNAAREFDGFAFAKAHPRDFKARVWRYALMREGRAAGFSEDGTPNQKTYKPEELLREARAIRGDFKGEKWFQSVILRLQLAAPGNISAKIGKEKAQYQAALLRQAALAEPGNAYYPLLEANLWRRRGNTGAMWRALNRAAGCSTLDTHEQEWAVTLVEAHEAVRPLILEERETLWRNYIDANWQELADWPPFLTNDTFSARKNGDHRRVLAVGALMARIGDLMQRGKNTRAMALRGAAWKTAAWNLAPRPSKRYPILAADFARYARSHGRADVAARVPVWAARQRQLSFLSAYPSYSRFTPEARRDALWHAGLWRDAGAFVGAHLIFVAACWLVVNLFLWRAVGAVSPLRSRVIPALLMAIFSAALGWWATKQIDILLSTPWTTRRRSNFEIPLASLALLAAIGAPFLLAVWTAAATLWRHKTQFLKPARVETELRLTPGQTAILKSGATILCTFSLLATLFFWLLWIGLSLGGVTTLDPFGWLSNVKSIGPQPVDILTAPLVYCLFLDLIALVLWFLKWRYFSGAESRALTHGGLCSWKETLGFYLVFGSAIYLGVALVGWPARAQASRELETCIMRGELPLGSE